MIESLYSKQTDFNEILENAKKTPIERFLDKAKHLKEIATNQKDLAKLESIITEIQKSLSEKTVTNFQFLYWHNNLERLKEELEGEND